MQQRGHEQRKEIKTWPGRCLSACVSEWNNWKWNVSSTKSQQGFVCALHHEMLTISMLSSLTSHRVCLCVQGNKARNGCGCQRDSTREEDVLREGEDVEGKAKGMNSYTRIKWLLLKPLSTHESVYPPSRSAGGEKEEEEDDAALIFFFREGKQMGRRKKKEK